MESLVSVEVRDVAVQTEERLRKTAFADWLVADLSEFVVQLVKMPRMDVDQPVDYIVEFAVDMPKSCRQRRCSSNPKTNKVKIL